MKYSALILFAIIGFLSSCGPKINSTQQEQLANLTDSISTITSSLNSLDSAALSQLTEQYFERKNYIQNEMTDTLVSHVIFKLDSFLVLRKGMTFIRKEYSKIKREANIMEEQLTNLNHDVSKRLVEENQFNRYYELENTNLQELKTASSKLLSVIKFSKKNYFEMEEDIDLIISTYKAKLNE